MLQSILLFTLIYLPLLVIARLCYKHYQVMQRAKFYLKQGAVKLPGFDTFIIGNIKQLLDYEKLKNQTIAQNLKPMPYIISWLFDKM